MFEIEKFLKDIDLGNLGKKLSQKRNSFTDNINPTQHEIINKKQLFCAVSLDLCFLLFQEYMTTHLNNLNKLNEIEENRLGSFSETLSEVTQSHEELNAKYPNRQEAEQTFELYELSLTNLYLRLSHANDMNEVNAL